MKKYLTITAVVTVLSLVAAPVALANDQSSNFVRPTKNGVHLDGPGKWLKKCAIGGAGGAASGAPLGGWGMAGGFLLGCALEPKK